MATTATEKQIRASRIILQEMAKCIKDSGGIPSGHLYAALQNQLDLSTYQQFVGILKRAGLVKESGHFLTYLPEESTSTATALSNCARRAFRWRAAKPRQLRAPWRLA